MNISVLNQTVRKLAEASFSEPDLSSIKRNSQVTSLGYASFVDNLITEAHGVHLALIQHTLSPDAFRAWIAQQESPVVYFEGTPQSYAPVVAWQDAGRKFFRVKITPSGTDNITKGQEKPILEADGNVRVLTAFPMESVGGSTSATDVEPEPLTPYRRMLRLLGNEGRDIRYLYVYAIVTGLISLSLPLGIQAIVGLIQGGLVFSSVYLLVALVIIGTIVAGSLQIVQISLVEILQRRVFVKAAFEFAYRIPRIRSEALLKYYPPELMNRFFDILTVQKALPKILIDITTAVIQVCFGLILLSLYHPFFIVFGLFTLMLIFIVFRVNTPKGLETSLIESKYKYKIAHWLEDIARTLYSFKVVGNTNLPLEKMDGLLNNYLKYRKKHFKVLLIFFWNAIAFKTIVTGGLLILGTALVVDRQISLGQFVASEIIILLISGSVEKLINSVDVIFDMLTAVEKLGNVTDLPLETNGGFRVNFQNMPGPMSLAVRGLSYKYPDGKGYILHDINLDIAPGERVVLTGKNASGRDTFLKILGGLLTGFEGSVLYNGLSIRDLHLNSLRDVIEKNISKDDIFDGTLMDNITMGRSGVCIEDVTWAIENLQLRDTINALPEGLLTPMIAGGKKFSTSFLTKLTMARCIVERPKLLLFTDVYGCFDEDERKQLLDFLCHPDRPWTFLTISHDPVVQAACQRTLSLTNGKLST